MKEKPESTQQCLEGFYDKPNYAGQKDILLYDFLFKLELFLHYCEVYLYKSNQKFVYQPIGKMFVNFLQMKREGLSGFLNK